jgi:hypothetical protein
MFGAPNSQTKTMSSNQNTQKRSTVDTDETMYMVLEAVRSCHWSNNFLSKPTSDQLLLGRGERKNHEEEDHIYGEETEDFVSQR